MSRPSPLPLHLSRDIPEHWPRREPSRPVSPRGVRAVRRRGDAGKSLARTHVSTTAGRGLSSRARGGGGRRSRRAERAQCAPRAPSPPPTCPASALARTQAQTPRRSPRAARGPRRARLESGSPPCRAQRRPSNRGEGPAGLTALLPPTPAQQPRLPLRRSRGDVNGSPDVVACRNPCGRLSRADAL